VCVVEAEFSVQIIFDADIAQLVTEVEVERSDCPRLYVRRGGIAALCADRAFS
jgi:hypothetical protein